MEKKPTSKMTVHGTPPAGEKAEEPRFMFTCDGVVHGMDLDGMRGPVFANTQQAAEQFVATLKMHHGINVVIAEIQADPRQLFEALLAREVLDGANCYFVFDLGEVQLAIVPLDSIHHEVDGWIVRTTDTELPQYTVTLDEQIMSYSEGTKTGPVLAYTHEVAERFAAERKRSLGDKGKVTDLRADTDMTVAELLDHLAKEGANCACVIRSVADDGEAKWDFIYPLNLPAE